MIKDIHNRSLNPAKAQMRTLKEAIVWMALTKTIGGMLSYATMLNAHANVLLCHYWYLVSDNGTTNTEQEASAATKRL